MAGEGEQGDKEQGAGQPAELTVDQRYATAINQIDQMRIADSPDPDHFSILRPPNWNGPPPNGSLGTWDVLDPPAATRVKLILMKPPKLFDGKHDDIERFVRDCSTYFEGPRYQYPDWDDFIREFQEQFCDTAIEEIHKKRMGEIKIGGDSANTFFQKIEQEAKLANRRDDTDPQGTMMYDQWKERICQMYEQHQIQKAYKQAHDINNHPDKKPNLGQKQITTTSSKNTTGGTSSSLTGNDKNWGAGSKQVAVKGKTYGGAGEPMQIDWKKYMSEGQCFNCDEKGHISKNFPKLKKQQVHPIETVPAEPLTDTTKIAEVKE
ncbi:hypothetical protein ARMGADRAFT_1087876 [Armillaria gallica]|uniref:CCHC-type domain-containing protein n=1 Tax=Armillaria gallica TaxID=47427 RepID=A0A2H3CPH0_ARMGA|nr:hypothetical protein ARMGADRAFT_1087876 [Armillaria gallica]